jgi:outer membrane biosynthesis protein TonB
MTPPPDITQSESAAIPEEEDFHAGTDTSVPDRDDNLGAGNISAEIDSTTAPEGPEPTPTHQQQQQTEQQQQQTTQQEQQQTEQQQPVLTKPRQPTPPPTQPTSHPAPLKTPPGKGAASATKVVPAKAVPAGSKSTSSRELSLHVSPAAAALATTKTTKRTTPATASFVLTKTTSGNSLGSLGHYSMDWNNADIGEVSSGNPNARLHPAGPSNLAQKVYAARLAMQEVDKVALVRTQPYSLYISIK